MPSITYESRTLMLQDGESVLACMTRNGIAVPSSCRAGACQSCLMRTIEGVLPAQSQVGLKDSLREQGYFLACMAVPSTDLTVALPGEAVPEVAAVVFALDLISVDVMRVRLMPEERFNYHGGQFASLIRQDGLIRPYSIASLPGRDDSIELHVRLTPGGAMSEWVHRRLSIGDRVRLRGPAGDCFYSEGSSEQPILLAGTGTGLAPLYAIVQDALRHQHRGPILLVHGALNQDGFYLVDELSELAGRHSNLTYIRCMPEGDPLAGVDICPVDRLIAARIPKPNGWRAFLCGHPGLVHDLRKKLFLAGASLKHIHSDAFISTPH